MQTAAPPKQSRWSVDRKPGSTVPVYVPSELFTVCKGQAMGVFMLRAAFADMNRMSEQKREAEWYAGKRKRDETPVYNAKGERVNTVQMLFADKKVKLVQDILAVSSRVSQKAAQSEARITKKIYFSKEQIQKEALKMCVERIEFIISDRKDAIDFRNEKRKEVAILNGTYREESWKQQLPQHGKTNPGHNPVSTAPQRNVSTADEEYSKFLNEIEEEPRRRRRCLHRLHHKRCLSLPEWGLTKGDGAEAVQLRSMAMKLHRATPVVSPHESDIETGKMRLAGNHHQALPGWCRRQSVVVAAGAAFLGGILLCCMLLLGTVVKPYPLPAIPPQHPRAGAARAALNASQQDAGPPPAGVGVGFNFNATRPAEKGDEASSSRYLARAREDKMRQDHLASRLEQLERLIVEKDSTDRLRQEKEKERNRPGPRGPFFAAASRTLADGAVPKEGLAVKAAHDLRIGNKVIVKKDSPGHIQKYADLGMWKVQFASTFGMKKSVVLNARPDDLVLGSAEYEAAWVVNATKQAVAEAAEEARSGALRGREDERLLGSERVRKSGDDRRGGQQGEAVSADRRTSEQDSQGLPAGSEQRQLPPKRQHQAASEHDDGTFDEQTGLSAAKSSDEHTANEQNPAGSERQRIDQLSPKRKNQEHDDDEELRLSSARSRDKRTSDEQDPTDSERQGRDQLPPKRQNQTRSEHDDDTFNQPARLSSAKSSYKRTTDDQDSQRLPAGSERQRRDQLPPKRQNQGVSEHDDDTLNEQARLSSAKLSDKRTAHGQDSQGLPAVSERQQRDQLPPKRQKQAVSEHGDDDEEPRLSSAKSSATRAVDEQDSAAGSEGQRHDQLPPKRQKQAISEHDDDGEPHLSSAKSSDKHAAAEQDPAAGSDRQRHNRSPDRPKEQGHEPPARSPRFHDSGSEKRSESASEERPEKRPEVRSEPGSARKESPGSGFQEKLAGSLVQDEKLVRKTAKRTEQRPESEERPEKRQEVRAESASARKEALGDAGFQEKLSGSLVQDEKPVRKKTKRTEKRPEPLAEQEQPPPEKRAQNQPASDGLPEKNPKARTGSFDKERPDTGSQDKRSESSVLKETADLTPTRTKKRRVSLEKEQTSGGLQEKRRTDEEWSDGSHSLEKKPKKHSASLADEQAVSETEEKRTEKRSRSSEKERSGEGLPLKKTQKKRSTSSEVEKERPADGADLPEKRTVKRSDSLAEEQPGSGLEKREKRSRSLGAERGTEDPGHPSARPAKRPGTFQEQAAGERLGQGANKRFLASDEDRERSVDALPEKDPDVHSVALEHGLLESRSEKKDGRQLADKADDPGELLTPRRPQGEGHNVLLSETARGRRESDTRRVVPAETVRGLPDNGATESWRREATSVVASEGGSINKGKEGTGQLNEVHNVLMSEPERDLPNNVLASEGGSLNKGKK
eukprot:gene8739-13537_t